MASSSRNPTKRKRVVLLIDSKIAVLDRLKGGASHKRLADDFGIGTSTIGDIKRDEAKIRAFASTMDSMAVSKKGRKVMRLAINSMKLSISGLFRSAARMCLLADQFSVRKLYSCTRSFTREALFLHFRLVEAGSGDFVIATELGNFLCREKRSPLILPQLSLSKRSYNN